MNTKSAYLAGESAQTIRSVVAVFDLLGFTEETREAFRCGRGDELLNTLIAAVANWYAVVRDTLSAEHGQQRLWDTKVFTDNVVVGQPLRSDGETELGYMLEDLASVQLGLIHEGFFVRGGVAVGQLFMSDDIVYGPGLLDAHDAELQAGNPRILIHISALELLKMHSEYYASVEASPQNRIVRIDEDGKAFLNYLDAFWPDHTEAPDYAALVRHRDTVAERLDRFASDSKIRAKYEWAARYHNYFCAETYGAEGYAIPLSNKLRARKLSDLMS